MADAPLRDEPVSSADFHAFDFVTPLCLAAHDVAQALHYACRFSALWSECGFTIEQDAEQVTLCALAASGRASPPDWSTLFASWHALLSRIVASPIHPLAVYLTVAPSAWRLACPVHLGSSRPRLCYAATLLQAEVPTANAGLFRLLCAYGERRLQDLTHAETTTAKVRVTLAGQPNVPVARAERVARQLGIGVRTLHRRLRVEHTSFRQLLAAHRIDQCMRELELSSRSAKQVAYGLGFSDPTSFYRAFKRWTGQTVSAYRQADETRRSDLNTSSRP